MRNLISHRQVVSLISLHTFGNLLLRPPGVYRTGQPPDEVQYERLGARMAAANHYTNQPSFKLYDTTGSTEDWSYWNTGGYGFTFEIGTEGFHPPYHERGRGGVPRPQARRGCGRRWQPRGVLPDVDGDGAGLQPLADPRLGPARAPPRAVQALHHRDLAGDRRGRHRRLAAVLRGRAAEPVPHRSRRPLHLGRQPVDPPAGRRPLRPRPGRPAAGTGRAHQPRGRPRGRRHRADDVPDPGSAQRRQRRGLRVASAGRAPTTRRRSTGTRSSSTRTATSSPRRPRWPTRRRRRWPTRSRAGTRC